MDQGFRTCISIVAKADYENRVPFAITFILSLSARQLEMLADMQHEVTKHQDPLFISSDFVDGLDQIQTSLLQESQLWSLPKSLLFAPGLKIGTDSLVVPESKDP